LSICYGIVQKLGGRIEFVTPDLDGATIRITLPPVRVTSPRAGEPTPRSHVPVKGRILVVDDEALVAESMQRMLASHEVTVVHSGRAAQSALNERPSAFEVVLCDIMMPGMSGIELYESIRVAHPDIAQRFVFVSGGGLTGESRRFLESARRVLLAKPVTPRELERAVQDVLAVTKAPELVQ
jgi:CheY-like chemotaxis protein